MNTVTVTVEKVTQKSGKRKNGEDFTRYALKDQDGNWYSTFNRDAFGPAAEGGTFDVDYEQDGDFKNISAVREAEDQPPEPKFGDGSYVKGRENPDTQRSISASVALQQAVATVSHTIGQSMTPKQASERVLPLASAYFGWLLQRAGLERDEDVPF